VRFNALSRAIESALQKEGIPSRVLGGHKFFERQEVRDPSCVSFGPYVLTMTHRSKTCLPIFNSSIIHNSYQPLPGQSMFQVVALARRYVFIVQQLNFQVAHASLSPRL
jgi:hypothetical protein